jgi:hypothetical protein
LRLAARIPDRQAPKVILARRGLLARKVRKAYRECRDPKAKPERRARKGLKELPAILAPKVIRAMSEQ